MPVECGKQQRRIIMKDVEVMAKYCKGLAVKYKWSRRTAVNRFLLMLSDAGKYMVKYLPRDEDGYVQWNKLCHIERKRAEILMNYRKN